MELHAGLVGVVGVDVDVVNPLGVEVRRTAYEAVDIIAFCEEEFRKVGSVLASNSSDEGDLARGLVR